MIRKLILASAAVAVLAMPAFAATEFFVAKDVKTKKCAVSDKKPDGKAMMMIGEASFKTAVDATAAMKTAVDCK